MTMRSVLDPADRNLKLGLLGVAVAGERMGFALLSIADAEHSIAVGRPAQTSLSAKFLTILDKMPAGQAIDILRELKGWIGLVPVPVLHVSATTDGYVHPHVGRA